MNASGRVGLLEVRCMPRMEGIPPANFANLCLLTTQAVSFACAGHIPVASWPPDRTTRLRSFGIWTPLEWAACHSALQRPM